MWARGDEMFAEVELPDAAGGVSGFGVHPALLDAALHVAIMASETPEVVLPFSWQDVSLHAAGASAVRARIAPAGSPARAVPPRQCPSNWLTGWGCRCCRWARWWPAR